MSMDLFKLRAMLLKLENVEGTDSSPTAVANAMQIIGGEGQLLTDPLSRDIDYPVFTGRPFVNIRRRGTVRGTVELLGAATPGEPSPLDPLLQIAGHAFTETQAGVEGVYNPVSEGIPSASCYFYHGGERLVLTGARAALTRMIFSINDFPKAEFELQGSPNSVSESGMPADVDYSAFQEPVAISTESFTMTIADKVVSGVSMQIDTGAQLTLVEHSEARNTRLTDRQTSGTLRLYRPDNAHLNIRSLVDSHARVPISVQVEGPAGRGVFAGLTAAQLGQPRQVDIDGFAGWEIPFTAIIDSGNDEYLIGFF